LQSKSGAAKCAGRRKPRVLNHLSHPEWVSPAALACAGLQGTRHHQYRPRSPNHNGAANARSLDQAVDRRADRAGSGGSPAPAPARRATPRRMSSGRYDRLPQMLRARPSAWAPEYTWLALGPTRRAAAIRSRCRVTVRPGCAAFRPRASSATMAIEIVTPEGADALTEFLRFQDEVYSDRSARWPAFVPFQLGLLTGESPFAQDSRKARRRGVRALRRVSAGLVAIMGTIVVHPRSMSGGRTCVDVLRVSLRR